MSVNQPVSNHVLSLMIIYKNQFLVRRCSSQKISKCECIYSSFCLSKRRGQAEAFGEHTCWALKKKTKVSFNPCFKNFNIVL